jgi:hypothetical protein
MTPTLSIGLKRYIKPNGDILWCAYLPAGEDGPIASTWAPRPIEALKMLSVVCPALVVDLVEPFNPSQS